MPVTMDVSLQGETFEFDGAGETWLRIDVGSRNIVRWNVIDGDFDAVGGTSCRGSSPTHVQLIGGVQREVFVHVTPVFTGSCESWTVRLTLEF